MVRVGFMTAAEPFQVAPWTFVVLDGPSEGTDTWNAVRCGADSGKPGNTAGSPRPEPARTGPPACPFGRASSSSRGSTPLPFICNIRPNAIYIQIGAIIPTGRPWINSSSSISSGSTRRSSGYRPGSRSITSHPTRRPPALERIPDSDDGRGPGRDAPAVLPWDKRRERGGPGLTSARTCGSISTGSHPEAVMVHGMNCR
ncbi:MAG: hypothetical protein M0C28_47065 [Candidatus Moduliflexus flocculans]|nr:hypothetical protein [Candidatus Moduliflexus flocculans]